jgi:hypothetical protein
LSFSFAISSSFCFLYNFSSLSFFTNLLDQRISSFFKLTSSLTKGLTGLIGESINGIKIMEAF